MMAKLLALALLHLVPCNDCILSQQAFELVLF